MSIKFKDCVKVSKEYLEHNDCTVKAVAIATNQPYIKAHRVLKEAGRLNKRGTYNHVYMGAVATMGFEAKHVHTGAKTISTLHKYLDPNKRYICQVRGHALAFVNGSVEDWTEGRKHRIKNVWEIIPLQSKNALRKAARYSV